jgi:hypothetical protein
MDPNSIAVAKEVQAASWDKKFGNFVHCPISSDSKSILSTFQQERLSPREIKLCNVLNVDDSVGLAPKRVSFDLQESFATTPSRIDRSALEKTFPQSKDAAKLDFERTSMIASGSHSINIGVAFCGRQASGGHDVIAGLASIKQAKLYGFIGLLFEKKIVFGKYI